MITKMGWATLWATFAQTHKVTLTGTNIRAQPKLS
jgi:hypothetical protein